MIDKNKQKMKNIRDLFFILSLKCLLELYKHEISFIFPLLLVLHIHYFDR